MLSPSDLEKLDQSTKLLLESNRLRRAGLIDLAGVRFREAIRLRRLMTVNPDATHIPNEEVD